MVKQEIRACRVDFGVRLMKLREIDKLFQKFVRKHGNEPRAKCRPVLAFDHEGPWGMSLGFRSPSDDKHLMQNDDKMSTMDCKIMILYKKFKYCNLMSKSYL